jgi:gliding motility-associated-like protein
MRKIFIFFLFTTAVLSARADHITGGEMYYTFIGISNSGVNSGNYIYNVTLKLFMRCNSGRAFNDPTLISIFDRSNSLRVTDLSIPLSSQQTLNYTNNNPCITNPPAVCYVVGYFNFTVALPPNAAGYVIASQVNYRIAGINNLSPGYGTIGATYTAEIPGTSSGPDDPKNSSAHFTGDDLVIVCAENSFSYSFAAEDNDGDQLRYSFCDAYKGGPGGSPGSAVPPSAPPYQPLPYGFPTYTSGTPLGNKITINKNTGLITGLAPGEGKYVITVCVEEIRHGIVIATQRKDLQINIASCSIAAAKLLPAYILCKDNKTITVSNLSTSPLINTYNWQFINGAGAIIFNSTAAVASYTFPDTGVYTIKLFINTGQQCSDSATAIAKVYPGFVPGFKFTGICINKPTQFTDQTTSVYGIVNSWNWNLTETSSNNPDAILQNPVFTYSTLGTRNVRLITGDSKGCIDTAYKDIVIVDKPPIALAFRDTLICITDKVQLQASGTGSFNWTPAANIINANTASPTVSPAATTVYFVDLDEDGCKNRDSVKINVVDHVNLQAMADTIICKSDPIQLHIVSDGLHYSWTPALQLNNPGIANPTAITNATTVYEVTAIIGSCSAKDNVMITAIPYPAVNAGSDTLICFHTTAQLYGSTDGSSFLWTPAGTLNNAGILNPVATPFQTTAYVLSAFDNKGCPKPGKDTVVVTMLPAINASAGSDTSIVVDQPLQLHATGGIRYEWSPPGNLSAVNIANPVALFKEPVAASVYNVLVYNEANCSATASIKIKVYKTLPAVFVPNAFTPNGDHKNDLLRPIAVGIRQIEYFNVYNRWGQLVFSESSNSESGGWNGRVGGKDQAEGAFVWVVKAIDYTGAEFIQKGVVLLIR